MSDVRAHSDLLGKPILHVAIVAVCPLIAWFALDRGKLPTLAVIGLVGMVVGVYVGLRQPLWLFWGLAVVIGLVPFGYFPGVHAPLYLPFAAGAVLAALVHPGLRTGIHPIEGAVIALLLTCGLAFLATLSTVTDVAEFIKWSISTLVLIALLSLSRDNLARFGRIFVYAVSANGLIGIATSLTNGSQMFIRAFSIFGYGAVDSARFVFSNEGLSRTIRLGGLWVDPNAAGLALVMALAIGFVLLRGRVRMVCSAILVVAIALTLSRSAIFSVLVGLLMVFLFHAMRARDRQIAIGGIVFAVIAALSVPAIRNRIFSSFGADDAGSSARKIAFFNFPRDMAGDWLFGKPWGAPEFKSGAVAFNLNFAANATLDAIYRGGIFVGIVFVTLLVIACVISYRALRSNSLPLATYGGLFIGLTLVAFQLDHPIVLIQQIALTFSIFLAFLVYVDRERRGLWPEKSAPTGVFSTSDKFLTPTPQ
jgi:hypothetical protein